MNNINKIIVGAYLIFHKMILGISNIEWSKDKDESIIMVSFDETAFVSITSRKLRLPSNIFS